MTPDQPPRGQPAAAKHAVPGDRFRGIGAACRMKLAAPNQVRPHQALVHGNQQQARPTSCAGREVGRQVDVCGIHHVLSIASGAGKDKQVAASHDQSHGQGDERG